MGLLDMLNEQAQDPAKAQGILQFGLSLLQSKGGLGAAIGAAGQQGLLGAQNYRQQQFQKQQQQFQLGQQKRQQDLQNLPAQFLSGGMKPDTMDNRDVGQPGEAAVPGQQFDAQAYGQALMAKDPAAGMAFLQSIQKQQPKFETLKAGEVGGSFVNGVFTPAYRAPPSQEHSDPVTKLVAARNALPAGHPDRAVYDAAILKATTHQPGTNIKIDNKMGEGLAKEVGPLVKESYDSARGAQQAITNADSLIQAIDSNKVFTGPGATLRLKGAQVAQSFGIGGKDDAEKIANTRQAIQGLAQSTLASRASLKGQGAVSDFEGKLIERAASGDVNDMTAAEIKQIAVVNKRLAKQQLSNHGQLVKKLKGNQATDGIANMFELPEQAPLGGVVNFGDLK